MFAIVVRDVTCLRLALTTALHARRSKLRLYKLFRYRFARSHKLLLRFLDHILQLPFNASSRIFFSMIERSTRIGCIHVLVELGPRIRAPGSPEGSSRNPPVPARISESLENDSAKTDFSLQFYQSLAGGSIAPAWPCPGALPNWRKRRQFAILRQFKFQRSGHRLHGFELCDLHPRAYLNNPTFIAGRTPG